MIDPELSLPACQTVDNSAMWMLENLLDLPGTEKGSLFFEDGCPTSQLTLLPHQRAQASLFTGVGGFGLSSTEARRMSVSVGSMMATVPEVLANLSGNIGEKARRGFPSRTSSAAFGGPPRRALGFGGSHGEHRAGKLAGQSLPSRRAGEQDASGQSAAEVPPAHDAETTGSSKGQNRWETW